jgi:hypothetical protein
MATTFFPIASAPGVVMVLNGIARVLTVEAALHNQGFLLRIAADAERDAVAALALGNSLLADFQQGMADGFKLWAAEIDAALTAQPALCTDRRAA